MKTLTKNERNLIEISENFDLLKDFEIKIFKEKKYVRISRNKYIWEYFSFTDFPDLPVKASVEEIKNHIKMYLFFLEEQRYKDMESKLTKYEKKYIAQIDFQKLFDLEDKMISENKYRSILLLMTNHRIRIGCWGYINMYPEEFGIYYESSRFYSYPKNGVFSTLTHRQDYSYKNELFTFERRKKMMIYEIILERCLNKRYKKKRKNREAMIYFLLKRNLCKPILLKYEKFEKYCKSKHIKTTKETFQSITTDIFQNVFSSTDKSELSIGGEIILDAPMLFDNHVERRNFDSKIDKCDFKGYVPAGTWLTMEGKYYFQKMNNS